MSRITLWLSVGVFLWGFASCSITCPDGSVCSDISTCCKTQDGYACCHYPKAVCCSDMAHCCPSGYHCNLVTQLCEKADQPWLSIPMVKKDAAEKLTYPFLYKQALPSAPASVIPTSEKKGHLKETPETALTQTSAGSPEAQVIRCDSLHYCQQGMSCCKGPSDQWTCCPYPLASGHSFSDENVHILYREKHWFEWGVKEAIYVKRERPSLNRGGGLRGQCCADGQHCCEYGYTCDASSLKCRRSYS